MELIHIRFGIAEDKLKICAGARVRMNQSCTVLLTGGSGFIGKNLLECLKPEENYTVLVPGHMELDLLSQSEVESYFDKHHIDIVIHAANTNMSRIGAFDVLNKNLQMFFNLEKCHNKYGRMYYFGSGAEYDKSRELSLIEEGCFGNYIPQDPYGFAKYIMGKTAENSKNIYDLVLFGVYGKYEEWQRRFISNNLCRCLKGLPMTLSQNAAFDYLFIDDFCQIMKWFLAHEPERKRYNVCSGVSVDLLTLAEEINQVTGLEMEIQIAMQGRKVGYTGNNERLLSELGNFQFTDRKRAIKGMWEYYKGIEGQIVI